jgi:DNA-binding MurR/RpiR family transcriptional regulator
MVDKNDEPMLSRIRRHYRKLPPSERKLADLILDFPGDVASYSATELANLAEVSKAAATRMFRRLGYDSFEQARRSARKQQDRGSPLYKLSHETEVETPDSYLRRQMERELTNMTHTFEMQNPAELENIGEQLVNASRIWTIGFRQSYFLADYARWQFLQVRDHVQPLVSEGSALVENIVDLQSEDIVVAIGFRRRTTRFIQTLKSVQRMGIPILYITDPSASTSKKYATWVLQAEVSGAGTFDSYPSASSLIHLLSLTMLKQAGRVSRSRMKLIEEIHSDLHDFD